MISPMKDIYAHTDEQLLWVQTSPGGMHYALQGNDDVLATVAPNTQGAGVVAKSADHTWTFVSSGLVKSRVIVKAGLDEIDYAIYTKHWLGRSGTLEIDTTTEYRFECSKFLCQERVWLDFHDRILIRLLPQSDNPVLKVAVLPMAQDNPDMSLLTLLGLYLIAA